jgi:hypothetical protein
MRVSKKTKAQLTDAFEGALDYCPALDRVPFHIKREAAEAAAKAAAALIEEPRQ